MSEKTLTTEQTAPRRGGWLAMVFIGAVLLMIGGGMASGGIAILNVDRWGGRIDYPAGFDPRWLESAAAVVTGVGIALVLAAFLLIVWGAHGWGRRSELAATPASGGYPAGITGHLDSPSRALWLVKWLLLIPHAIVLGLLWTAFWPVSIVAWFAILFTRRYPLSLFTFTVGVVRWSWRVGFYGYSALGTDAYPPFSLDSRPYPADLAVAYPERLSRGLVLVKSWLLAIPHLILVAVLTGWGSSDGRGVAVLTVLVVIAAIALLFTGRYPPGVFDLVMGIDRWAFRTMAYVALLRDDYPPFRLDQGSDEPAVSSPK
ncbi:MAG: DUF4389 domain-containing protein [Microbacteriaceae bacterium]